MKSEIKIQATEIKIVPIKDLTLKKGNRNSHPQEQIERIAKLYEYQGFRNPITVSNQSGEVVCGNGRVLAAIRAGLKEVPVIYQDFDNQDQEYAHHVADNAVSLFAELDLSGINSDLGSLGPEFDLDFLGIEDFKLDMSEKDIEKIEKEVKVCPHCNEPL